MKKTGGGHTESSIKTLKHLTHVHFPGCGIIEVTTHLVTATSITGKADENVKEDEVAYAIRSIERYESSGQNGMVPVMLPRNSLDNDNLQG